MLYFKQCLAFYRRVIAGIAQFSIHPETPDVILVVSGWKPVQVGNLPALRGREGPVYGSRFLVFGFAGAARVGKARLRFTVPGLWFRRRRAGGKGPSMVHGSWSLVSPAPRGWEGPVYGSRFLVFGFAGAARVGRAPCVFSFQLPGKKR
jgi:hypothetical protein